MFVCACVVASVWETKTGVCMYAGTYVLYVVGNKMQETSKVKKKQHKHEHKQKHMYNIYTHFI